MSNQISLEMRSTTTANNRKSTCSPSACQEAATAALDELETLPGLIAVLTYHRRQFFADCGIPYRRGYLFHGPPGTGKSSFSAALAGHLQCDIYHVSSLCCRALQSLTRSQINLASGDFSDGNLHRLFLALPRKCIVVIEDIDSAGIGREQGPSMQPVPPPPDSPLYPSVSPFGRNIPPPPGDPRKRNTVTLSGLLNAIDGNASQEGSSPPIY
jgi:chaperone BCS1